MKKQVAALAADEKSVVMWDVDMLLSDCENRPILTVATELLIPKEWLTLDRAYAMTTDTTSPILLFELPHGKLFIADGNHRVYRASAEKIETMNAIVIPEEEHLRYLFQCTAEEYRVVIEALMDEGIFIDNFLHK